LISLEKIIKVEWFEYLNKNPELINKSRMVYGFKTQFKVYKARMFEEFKLKPKTYKKKNTESIVYTNIHMYKQKGGGANSLVRRG
jgi:hypothetical protein